MFSFNLNPTETNTVFTHTIGEFFQWLSIFAVNQVQVQRYLSVPSARDAKWWMINSLFFFFFYSIRLHLNISRASYLNLINYCLLAGFATVVGMVIFAYYHECDILKSDKIDHYEQVSDSLHFLFLWFLTILWSVHSLEIFMLWGLIK